MKHRVAIIAACLSFVLCISFLVLCGMFAREALQDGALEELARICRLSAAKQDSAAFDQEQTIERVRTMISASPMVAMVYGPDGKPVYCSRPNLQDVMPSEVLAGVKYDRINKVARNLSGTELGWLFALTRISDGAVLGIACPAYTMNDALGGKVLPLILLAVLFACVCMVIFQISANKTDRFVNEIQRVLENFSEGNFDSRAKGVQGDSLQQTAHFNEVMGRIQDRIFRQRTRNQALNTVMNHMQNGILAVDDQLNIILVTPAAKHLLNIVGSPEGLPIHQASKDVNMDQVLMDAMQQEGVYTNEVAVRNAVGRGRTPLRLYVSPMMKEGKAVGAVALVEDITELRRFEQIRTDFAANVSHELKTPLTSIKGFVETLLEGAIDNKEMALKFLRIIMMESERLTRLINDILSITKLESGTAAVPNKCIRLDEIANDVTDMLSIQASEKQVTVHSRVNDEPSYVMGNPDQVEQMLINLVENGIKYNKTGGKVTVSLYNTADMVYMTVVDTGIGVSDADQGRMFERFYRVDKGRSRSMGGTGLGLAIVKHIVQSMGGHIEVHSALGEGTEFLVQLPRVVGAENEDKDPFEDAAAAAYDEA